MRAYYHVTKKTSVPSILRRGLIPKIGPRSKKAGEDVRRVYLFDDMNSAEDAIMNWLGDEFDDDVELAVLEISGLPVSLARRFETRPDGFETTCEIPIPPEYIRVTEI